MTAWLHDGINDGLYTGQVEAIDNKKFTYRITFDRPGVGTLQVGVLLFNIIEFIVVCLTLLSIFFFDN